MNIFDDIKYRIQQYRNSFCHKGHSRIWFFFILIAPFCTDGAKLDDTYQGRDEIIRFILNQFIPFYIMPILLGIIWLDSKRDTRTFSHAISAFILGVCIWIAIYYIAVFYRFVGNPYLMIACIIGALIFGLFLVPMGILIVLLSIATMWFTGVFFGALGNVAYTGIFIILPFMPFILMMLSIVFYRRIRKETKEELMKYLLVGLGMTMILYGAGDTKQEGTVRLLPYKKNYQSNEQELQT